MTVTPPTTEEIRMAITQIRSGKSAVPDNIPPNALKSQIEATANMLHVLSMKIWEEEQVLTEGHVSKISKKGDLSK
ncbi:unnamed protein product [Schistosoma curassoni]|uniref:Focal_AT domain-containing protein n=1 Tax=Schistosoma curassoni TaxID=6186 RepID=A0A183L2J7_9TREM|nr:unnamed protein product [Schistosoma curassoni]